MGQIIAQAPVLETNMDKSIVTLMKPIISLFMLELDVTRRLKQSCYLLIPFGIGSDEHQHSESDSLV